MAPAKKKTSPANESYAKTARNARKEKTFKLISGEYEGKLKDVEFKKSQSGNDMFVFEYKIVKAPDNETMELVKTLKRTIKDRYVMNVDFQFKNFILLMEDFGVDLSEVRSRAEDPKFEDFQEICEALEDIGPKVKFKVVQKEGEQYPNISPIEVPAVLDEDFQDDDKPAPRKGKGKKAAPFCYYEDEDGEVLPASKEEIEALIEDGFSDEICIDKEWISLEDAGFSPVEEEEEEEEEEPAPRKRNKVEPEEEEEEEEEEPSDEPEDDLYALSLKELKALAKEEGATPKQLRGADKEDLVELIESLQGGDDEEEPEEEEPETEEEEKPARRKRGGASKGGKKPF